MKNQRYEKFFTEAKLSPILQEFKDSYIIEDEDLLCAELLTYYKFKPITARNITFVNDQFIGTEGKKGNDIGIAILTEGEYQNPMIITMDALKEMVETYNPSQKITIITNCGVELPSRNAPDWMKNIKVIKVPVSL